MPYLPIIIVFAQKYDKKAGIGTILAAMLHHCLPHGWTIMLLWVYAGIPLDPAPASIPEPTWPRAPPASPGPPEAGAWPPSA